MPRAIPAEDRRSRFALVGFLLMCFAVAALAGAVTLPAVRSWYPTLAKPPFTPPDWVFGPAWTILYAMMAVAAWRAWRTVGDEPGRRRAMSAFAVQLGLNLAWPFAFFGAHSPVAGLGVIALLEAAILITIALFARRDRWAAWLMVPYAAWTAFAAALNGGIVLLN